MFIVRETIETVFKEIVKDKKIMEIMNLPAILDEDTIETRNKKEKLLKEVILFSSESPVALGNNTIPDIEIDGKLYTKNGKIRMTICNLQSLSASNDIFGRPRFEIDIYHLNEDTLKALEIIKRLVAKFSDKKIDVEWEDDNGYKHISPTRIECAGTITNIPNVNFYEKSGVRFSYYSSYYSTY